MRDFNFESLRKKVQPAAIFLKKKGDYLSLSINAGSTRDVIEQIQSVWKKQTDLPFEFNFLNEQVDNQYKNEQSLHRMTLLFSVVSIIISCLGLVGLMTFVIRAREKEICIRKALGSTVMAIHLIFTREVVKLVLVSALIAVPLSVWLTRLWLQGFSYSVPVNPVTFLLAIGMLFTIAIASVSYFILKAAFVNPADYLRNE